jgi:hypothetical protein
VADARAQSQRVSRQSGLPARQCQNLTLSFTVPHLPVVEAAVGNEDLRDQAFGDARPGVSHL